MAEEVADGSGVAWARDGALAVLGANLGGLACIITVVSFRAGTHFPFDRVFAGLVGVSVVGPFLLGPLAGLTARWVWRSVPGHRWIALFVGFPIGAGVGLAQFAMLSNFLNSNGDAQMFQLIGGVGGGLVGSFGLPLYLLLRMRGRPGLPAVALFPMLAGIAILSAIGVGLWLLS